MANKTYLESFLRANGLGATSPDEEIRSLLLSAQFKEEEVDTAILVLRQNAETDQTSINGLHKVFRSDTGLHPLEVSRLLGIDLDVKEELTCRSDKKDLTVLEIIVVALASVVIAATALFVYMHIHSVGFFYPSVEPTNSFAESV